jgi:hypothetical protein
VGPTEELRDGARVAAERRDAVEAATADGAGSGR